MWKMGREERKRGTWKEVRRENKLTIERSKEKKGITEGKSKREKKRGNKLGRESSVE